MGPPGGFERPPTQIRSLRLYPLSYRPQSMPCRVSVWSPLFRPVWSTVCRSWSPAPSNRSLPPFTSDSKPTTAHGSQFTGCLAEILGPRRGGHREGAPAALARRQPATGLSHQKKRAIPQRDSPLSDQAVRGLFARRRAEPSWFRYAPAMMNALSRFSKSMCRASAGR